MASFPALQTWKNTSISLWGMAPAPSPRSKPSSSGWPRSWQGWALCCTETDGCGWLAPHWKTPNSCHTGYQTLTLQCGLSRLRVMFLTLLPCWDQPGRGEVLFTTGNLLLHQYNEAGQDRSNWDEPPDRQLKKCCFYSTFFFSLLQVLLTSTKSTCTSLKTQWSV